MKTRAEVWQLLQSESPDVAQVLTEVRRVFGKTPTPTIKVKGETVYSPVQGFREMKARAKHDRIKRVDQDKE